MNKHLVLLILCLGIICFESHAASIVINDHFNDEMLDPAWSVSFQNSTGWMYSESGTNITATDIYPDVINTQSHSILSTVSLSQTFTPLTDFNAGFVFSWDSAESVNAMQQLFITLYDSYDNKISSAGYNDAWVMYSGSQYALAGESIFNSGYNSLPIEGGASVSIIRSGDYINVLWNGVSLLSGTSDSPINRVALEFNYYAYNGDFGISFFGTESIDSVMIEGSPVPVPASILLFSSGILGFAGFRIRMSKKQQ